MLNVSESVFQAISLVRAVETDVQSQREIDICTNPQRVRELLAAAVVALAETYETIGMRLPPSAIDTGGTGG